QHDPADPLRVTLGVGEDQRGTPRTAVEQPAFDTEMFTQSLHIGDQMVGGVVRHIGRWERGVRPALTAAALIEQHDPEKVRVERPARSSAAASTGAAVYDES